jgi:hypothetical protein
VGFPRWLIVGIGSRLTECDIGITVVLKEEVTRQRIAAEKEAKKLRKGPWVQNPSRPIYGQQQYYRW